MNNETTDWLVTCPICLAKIGEECHSLISGCIPDNPHMIRMAPQRRAETLLLQRNAEKQIGQTDAEMSLLRAAKI